MGRKSWRVVMPSNTAMRFALGSSAAALLLAGCSIAALGPTTPGATTRSAAALRSFLRPDGSYQNGAPVRPHVALPPRARFTALAALSPGFAPGKLYVSDSSSVEVYKQNGTSPIDSYTSGLSGSPHGSYVDDFGTLYVTNFYANNIVEFPRGSHTPSVTLTNGVSGPISVVVGEDGTIYVAEFPTSTVLEFAKGASSPTATISIGSPESLTLNPTNRNLYVSYIDASGNGRVMRFPYHKTTGTDLGIIIGWPGQLEFD